MILVIGRVRCRPEKREELIAALTAMQDASRLEDGCRNYGFFAAIEDENSFIAVEEWESREILEIHFRTEHLRTFTSGVLEMVEGTPSVEIHEITGTDDIPTSVSRIAEGE